MLFGNGMVHIIKGKRFACVINNKRICITCAWRHSIYDRSGIIWSWKEEEMDAFNFSYTLRSRKLATLFLYFILRNVENRILLVCTNKTLIVDKPRVKSMRFFII